LNVGEEEMFGNLRGTIMKFPNTREPKPVIIIIILFRIGIEVSVHC